jgi:hypothetical protein
MWCEHEDSGRQLLRVQAYQQAHQRRQLWFWCKHAQPDQRNGSGKDQRQGPVEDAASGCDARSWSGLDEDAATCSQRCIAIRADLRVGCRGLTICASCRPLWHDLDSAAAGAKVHLAGEERGIDSGLVSDHRRTKYSLGSGCADLSNSKSVSVTERASISSSILREHVLGAHPNHTLAVYVNS